jgi:hypothetical protein
VNSHDSGRFAIGAGRSSEARYLVERHVDLVLGAVEARLASGWIGDEHSPLGESRHREAVCRRIVDERTAQRRGEPIAVTAAIIAGRHMLTIDALCDEYFGGSSGAATASFCDEATGVHRLRGANDNATRGRR